MPRFIREAPADPRTLDEVEAGELRRQAEEGLEARLAATGPAPGLTRDDYAARLDFELDVIVKMQLPRLFSDRFGLHQIRESATAFRSGRGAARARARLSPMR